MRKISEYFKRKTLKEKITFFAWIFSSVFLLFVFMSIWIFYRMSYLEQQSKLLIELESKTVSMHQNVNNFILNSSKSEVFLATGKSTEIDKWNEDFDYITSVFSKVKQMSLLSDYEGQTMVLQAESDLLAYKQNFVKFTTLLKDRGASGLGQWGEIEKVKLKVYDDLKFFNNDMLYSGYRELSSVISRYLSAPTDNLKNEIFLMINGITERLKPFSQGDSAVTIVTKSIRDLELLKRGAENYLFLALKLGITEKEGVFSSIQEKHQNLITVVVKLNTKVVDSIWFRKIVNYALFFIVILITIVVALYFTYRLRNHILHPISVLQLQVSKIASGNIPEKLLMDNKDEVANIADSLNELTDNLANTRKFVEEVGNGNLETEVNVFNNEGEIGRALLQMRAELLKIADERQQQEQENHKRNWLTHGIAKFSDILRKISDDLEGLGYEVLKELSSYINAAQGALFIINDKNPEDIHLETVSLFAYNRKKYVTKKIGFGEGLAGRCAREKQTIYMIEIPNGHFEITSGLGESNPTCLLIVPVKLNDELFGVIELASYTKLEPHQIQLVEKVGELVASSLANVRINIRTNELLVETKKQADELTHKEEEMRMGMEELQATQEEAARKEAVATGFVNSVNHSIIRADFKLDGTLEYANLKFLDVMGYKLVEVKGVHVSLFVDDRDKAGFEEQWKRIISGGKHIESEMRYKTRNGNHWFLTTYTPVKDAMGRVVKILYLAIDIEKTKQRNLEFEGEISAIDKSVIKAEFNPMGVLASANDMFYKTLRYSKVDLLGKDVFSLIKQTDQIEFEVLWQKVTKGMPLERQQCMLGKSAQQIWIQGVYTAVRSFDDDVYKIIFIGYDITEQKILQMESEKKAQMLLIQEQSLKDNIRRMEEVQNEKTLQETLMSSQLDAINRTNIMLEYDMDGNLLKSNTIFTEVTGYLPSDVHGRNFRIFLEQSDRYSNKIRDMWSMLKEGKSVEMELKRISKSGDYKYIKSVFSAIVDHTGHPFKVLELGFDITLIKQQEAELNGQLLAINKTSLWVEFDMEGTIKKVNENFCKVFGYSEHDLVGRLHRIIVNEKDKRSDDYKEMWNNLKNGHHAEGEFERLTVNKDIVYLRSIFYPIVDSSGTVYKIIKVAFDISASKQQELKLAELNYDLQKKEKDFRNYIEKLNTAQDEIRKKSETYKFELAQLQDENKNLKSRIEELEANKK